MRNLKHICPKILTNLNILYLDNIKFNPENFLQKIENEINQRFYGSLYSDNSVKKS